MAEGTSRNVRETENRSFNSANDDRPRDTTRRRNERITICRFYREGKCRYGPNCWYLHSENAHDPAARSTRRSEPSSSGSSRQRSRNRENSKAKSEVNKKGTYEPKFSSLSKNEPKSTSQNPPNWADAPEFVPAKIKSYAETLKCNIPEVSEEVYEWPQMEFCEHYLTGNCPFEDQCPFIHGDICELCGKACLDPYNEQQRKIHTEYCEQELEKDMELSFAIQRSRDKSCGICMDVIMEKEPLSERRFGILEKCNHVFCLSCIRKWRRVKSFENNSHIESVVDPVVTRACPECRVPSDFITPSQYWVDCEEEKKKLIADYKVALSKKDCKYFKQGKGTCPFGGACFYLHAKPDGTKVDLPLPTRRRRQNQDGELDFMGRIFLWDYLELRNDFWMQLELEDLVYSISDSDDDVSENSDNLFLSDFL